MSDRKGFRFSGKGFPCRFHHNNSPNQLNDNPYLPYAPFHFNRPESPQDHVVPEHPAFDDYSIDSEDELLSPPDVKSPIYSRSFINLLNDSDVIPDVDPEDELAYYEMMNEQMPVVRSDQHHFHFDTNAFLIGLEDSSIASEDTEDTNCPENDRNYCDGNNDFSFINATPEMFRSYFKNKENSYPDESLDQSPSLRYEDIMDLIFHSASPRITEEVFPRDPISPISPIVGRFLDQSVLMETYDRRIVEIESYPNQSSENRRNPSIVVTEYEEKDIQEELFPVFESVETTGQRNFADDMFQDGRTAVDAITPTTAHFFQFGRESNEKIDNIDECGQDDDEVFITSLPINTESDETMFHTPPNTVRDDEDFYSFLSSRSRKIARNMSAGRRDKIRDQDYGFVQPKKLFLD
ncbi:unnamed protein product [Auanema sp. JU1783]|nr:unnamed protein product [Auanema sp. JU1783]